MYEYLARVRKVIDGDTVDLTVDMGFHVTMLQRVRLRGVDAPEIRGPCREAGAAAKAFVQAALPEGTKVFIRTYKLGKYGRYIADLKWIPEEPEPTLQRLLEEGRDLAEALIEAGHGVAYPEV